MAYAELLVNKGMFLIHKRSNVYHRDAYMIMPVPPSIVGKPKPEAVLLHKLLFTWKNHTTKARI